MYFTVIDVGFLLLQVYVINVTYSDNTSHIIYRRYSKFFDLQVSIGTTQPMMLCGIYVTPPVLQWLLRLKHVNNGNFLNRYVFLCLFSASMSVLMFCTPRRLDEPMCVLVIGLGAGETWFVFLRLAELLQYATTLLSSLLFTVCIFTPSPFPAVVLSLISALPSKRQGADKPFLYGTSKKSTGKSIYYAKLYSPHP